MNKPVLLAGNGIRLAGMADKFVAFAERLGWPVLTTWKGADLIWDDHPLFFGRPGSIGSKYANMIIQNCDLFMSFGARLDLPSIGYSWKNFAPKADGKLVIRDDDLLKEFMGHKDYALVDPEWLYQCHEWKDKYPLPQSWVDEISVAVGPDDILVPGSSGMACEMLLQRFRVKKGQRVIFSPGLGAMGFGIPMAIGVAMASKWRGDPKGNHPHPPHRTIHCVVGDGCLQVNIQELQTIKRLDLPIKLYVLNNNGYASIRNMQKKHFNGRLVGCDPSSGLTLPQTHKIAWAYGLEINEILIDPDTQIHPRLQSTKNKDGTITPGRLEDVE